MHLHISENRNVLHVYPASKELLEVCTAHRVLREPAVRLVGGYPQRYMKMTTQAFPLYILTDDTTGIICPAGLRHVIIEHANTRRWTYEATGSSPVLPPMDDSAMPLLRPGQDVVLKAIAANPRGLIKCATAFGKSFLTATICALWPTQRFLILSTTASVCTGLYKAIQERLPNEQVFRMFGSHSKNKMKANCRVIVTTTQSMHKIQRDWPDVVLFDEVHGAGSPSVSEQLTDFLYCVCFGMSATPLDRTDSLNLVIESIFGRIIAEFGFEESRQLDLVAALHVHAVRCRLPEIKFKDDHEADLLGYWHNHARNKLLCDAAHERIPTGTILHYVSRFEHALVLRRTLLPGVPVAHGGLDPRRAADFMSKGLLTKEEAKEHMASDPLKLEDAFRAGAFREVIATGVWRQGTDLPDLDCVVRYDGESNVISCTQIPGRAARKGSDGQKKTALIIDSADDFGERFWRRWLARRRVYKKHNWPIMEL